MAHRTRYSPRARGQLGRTNMDRNTNRVTAPAHGGTVTALVPSHKQRAPSRLMTVAVDKDTRKRTPAPPKPRPPPARARANRAPHRPTSGSQRFDVTVGNGPSSRPDSGSSGTDQPPRRTGPPRPRRMHAWPLDAGKPRVPPRHGKGFSRVRAPATTASGAAINRGNHLTEPDVVIDALRHMMEHKPYAGFYKVFRDIDSDGSGSLSLAEMGTGLRQWFPGMSDGQVEEVMRRMDLVHADDVIVGRGTGEAHGDAGAGDGEISFVEFFDYLRSKVEESKISKELPCYLESDHAKRAAMPTATKKGNAEYAVGVLLAKIAESDARTVFKNLDENGDGVLTRGEFRNGLMRMGIGLYGPHLTELIELLDADGGGTIEFDEFISSLEDPKGKLAGAMGNGAPNVLRDAPPEASSAGNDAGFLNRRHVIKYMAALAKDRADVVEKLPTSYGQLKKQFQRMDTDQHSYVSVPRLTQYFGAELRTLSGFHLHASDARRLALLCDHNGDGYVQLKDALATLQKLHQVARGGGAPPPHEPDDSDSSDDDGDGGGGGGDTGGVFGHSGFVAPRVPRLNVGVDVEEAIRGNDGTLLPGGLRESFYSPRRGLTGAQGALSVAGSTPRAGVRHNEDIRGGGPGAGAVTARSADGRDSVYSVSTVSTRVTTSTDGPDGDASSRERLQPHFKKILRQIQAPHRAPVTRRMHSPRYKDTHGLIKPVAGPGVADARDRSRYTTASAQQNTFVGIAARQRERVNSVLAAPRLLADYAGAGAVHSGGGGDGSTAVVTGTGRGAASASPFALVTALEIAARARGTVNPITGAATAR